MFIGRVARKAALWMMMAAWAAVIIAGCGQVQEIFSTPSPWVFSSVTPRTSQTPAPINTPLPVAILTPTQVTPVQQGTGWQQSGKVISVENAANVQQVVNAGQGSPLQVLFSSDGQWLGLSTTNGVYLYDPTNLERLLSIRTGEHQLSLAFSADGRFVASGDWHGRVAVWDTAGDLQMELDAGTLPVLAAAFSPDGKWLAAGGWDGLIRLWGMEDGALERAIPLRNRAVRAVSFSSDGLLLYGWAPGESIQVWGVDDGKSRDDIYLGKDALGYPPEKAVFGQQGKQMAVYFARSIKVFTTRNGYTRLALNDLLDSVQGLALSEDGNTLAVMTAGDTMGPVIEIHDLESGILIARVQPAETGSRLQMALSPDGERLITLGTHLQSWNLSAGGNQIVQPEISGMKEFYPAAAAYGLAGMDGKVYLASSEGSLEVYDIDEGVSASISSITASPEADLYTSFAILPDELAAFGDAHGSITLVNLTTSETIHLPAHKGVVRSLAFSIDGTRLASGGEDGQILVQDLPGGSPATELDAGATAFRMAFLQTEAADNGYLILQTTADIQIWSLKDEVLLKQLAAQCMTVSSESGLLAGVSYGGGEAMVNIYHLPDGEVLQSFPLEGYRLAISPDGSLLAMGGKDLTLWSIGNGNLLHRLPDIPCCGPIQFTPDGASLVQILLDGSVQAWEIP